MDIRDSSGMRTTYDLERKYIKKLMGVEEAVEVNRDAIYKTNTTLEDFTAATLDTLDNMQSQIDGNITTYFYSGVPTLANLPASEWDESEYDVHLGDLYYDQSTGYAYRFYVNDGTYGWLKLTDSDVTEALALANAAQDTADAKRRVFVVEPTTPYDVGDIWFYNQELYRCQTSRASGNFQSNDWIKATKYTDDTAANNVSAALNSYKTEVASTYVTNSTFTTSNNAIIGRVEQDELKISSKAQVFRTTPTVPYYLNDVYIHDGNVYLCTTARSEGSYTASDWTIQVNTGELVKSTEFNQTVDGITIRVNSVEDNSAVGVTNEYAVNSSATTPPAQSSTDWSTDQPERGEGEYIWARIKTTYGDNSVTYSTPVNTTGDKGDTGAAGTSVTISSTEIKYQASSSGTTVPTGTWQTNVPSVTQGQYLWTRTIVNYSPSGSTTSYSVAYKGTDGQTGATGPQGPQGESGATGVSVSSIVDKYYLSTSNTTQSGGSWSTTIPTYVSGRYYWKKTTTTYSNSTTSDSTPVLDNALTTANSNASNAVSTVNNLQIGGRNLWIGSKDINNYSGIINGATSFEYGLDDQSVPSGKYFSFVVPSGSGNAGPYFTYQKNVVSLSRLESGETYILSFYIKGSAATTLVAANLYEGQTGVSLNTSSITTSWSKIICTFRWTNTTKNTICFYATKNSNNNTICISSIKLEKGNKSTDWTAAPEDTSDEINAINTSLGDLDDKIGDVSEDIGNAIDAEHNVIMDTLEGYATTDVTDGLNDRLGETESKTSSNEQNINDIRENGVSKVITTAGYTFDKDGLHITRTGAKTDSLYDETGITITDNTSSSATELFFAGFDNTLNESIVRTKNINVDKYFVMGKHLRVEDFQETGESEGTGFFYT